MYAASTKAEKGLKWKSMSYPLISLLLKVYMNCNTTLDLQINSYMWRCPSDIWFMDVTCLFVPNHYVLVRLFLMSYL
jgi:hypothetical protein